MTPAGRGVRDVVASMTLAEKRAQVTAVWVMVGAAGQVAPYEGRFAPPDERPLRDRVGDGAGALTRPLGSRPVDAAAGAASVAAFQREVVAASRFGIPALVHEECLTGVMALGATCFPNPLAWGASFDPDLVEEVAAAIGSSLLAVGARHGLAPVLDVVRDARWGRVEECIGESPHLVGVIGAAYVRGLQSAGGGAVAACGKHFLAHSASAGGRNLAPSHVGPRELRDVFAVPFEMAIVLGGLRTVMAAYQDVDGDPPHGSHDLLGGLLRDELGFDGPVVSDYFGVAHLHELHGVAEGGAGAAVRAVTAGVDLELPAGDCYLTLEESPALDAAVERILRLKAELGLWSPDAATASDAVAPPAGRDTVDLDPPEHRALARRLAERSVVLLTNDGMLPLAPAHLRRVAVVGPNADCGTGLLGNYGFPSRAIGRYDEPVDVPRLVTVVEGLREALPDAEVVTAAGCSHAGHDRDGIGEAVALAASSDVAVVVAGDHAGSFGGGTTGEGTDTDDLSLPGVQGELVAAVAATGTPTVLVLVTGRPYDVADVLPHVGAALAAWLPGEEGGAAIAAVLTGAVEPSGRSPVTWSRGAGQQPRHHDDRPAGHTAYARSSADPVVPFGGGLTYTTFTYGDLGPPEPELDVAGSCSIACTVANTGDRRGEEVVQLYVRRPVASVAQPALELKGFTRVTLDAGEAARVTFDVPADVLSFTGLDLQRAVEPGPVELLVGASAADIRLRALVTVTGARRLVGRGRAMVATAYVDAVPRSAP